MENALNLSGVLNFVMYFGLSLLALLAFKYLYTLVTPHDEWALVKEHANTAAAVGFAGAILGYAIALYGAASNSVSLGDFAIWAVIGLIAQLVAFAIVRFAVMPRIVRRLEQRELSAGILLAAVSIAVGLLNAACMTY